MVGKGRDIGGREKEEERRERRKGRRRRTISVASTLVPTILSRTFVFFSMICGGGSISRLGGCRRVESESESEMTHLFVRGVGGGVRVWVEFHVGVDELCEVSRV